MDCQSKRIFRFVREGVVKEHRIDERREWITDSALVFCKTGARRIKEIPYGERIGNKYEWERYEREVKILGHPLTRTDLLRALDKNNIYFEICNAATIDPCLKIELWNCKYFNKDKELGDLIWSLEHDLYKDQSEEARKFLCDILLEKS